MKSYKYDITYVFGNGRNAKLSSKQDHGKEFFYGYPYFLKKDYRLNIIETKNQNSSKLTKKILRFLDRFFAKFSKLTFYMAALISRDTLSQIYNSKNIITSNHGIGMSLFLYISFMKIFKKINFIVILSGLFSMKRSNIIVKVLRKIIFTYFLSVVDYLIFTNRSEYEFAVENYIKFESKFVCLPFCIDTDFWKPKSTPNFQEKKGVLFIGNNGHRDFDLVIEIANKLVNIPFTFITNRIKNEDVKFNNVTNILGDWNAGYLTDEEVKDYYEQARIVMLPINDTLVSSGQSAGLQAASVGTPVVTSRTIGFWDYKNYVNNKNVILLNDNTLDLWVTTIERLYNDYEKLVEISQESLNLVKSYYTLDKFDKNLEKYLFF
jgi:glycosyltransferase involved in cell wall biosynthesis